jgi:hypothetical protein
MKQLSLKPKISNSFSFSPRHLLLLQTIWTLKKGLYKVTAHTYINGKSSALTVSFFIS